MLAIPSPTSYLVSWLLEFYTIWADLPVCTGRHPTTPFGRAKLTLSSWQWFFIIEGGVSILVGIVAFFLLPDWPENTRWLTEDEREMAQYRVIVSNGGKEEQVGGTWDGLKEAVKDPFTWLFCGMHFSLINAQSFKDFFPSVSLSPFNFNIKQSLTIHLTDHQDLRLLRTEHLPSPSAPLRHSLRRSLRLRLVLQQIPRILLPHHPPDRGFRSRSLSHDVHPQRRRQIFRSMSPHQRNLQRIELAIVMGDDSGPSATEQESCADCYCKLRESVQSLVFAVLFPYEPGAFLQIGRRFDFVWMPMHCAALLGRQVVGDETEQEAG